MIVNELYSSAGFGNQLFMVVASKCIADKLGCAFGTVHPERFKGKDFLDLDFGDQIESVNNIDEGFSSILPEGIKYYYKENIIRNKFGVDITPFDPEMMRIKDNTKIDGHFQSLKYIEQYRNKIIDWLKIKEEKNIKNYNDDNICIIHMRGGDYIGSPSNTLLPQSYYINAITYMLNINPEIKFYIVTDDVRLASLYLPNVEIIGSSPSGIPDKYKSNYHGGGDISTDYSILHNAKNVIMSNSTFAFWPVWTNSTANVIAPKKWMNFNADNDDWSTSDMYVKEWKYLDKNGAID